MIHNLPEGENSNYLHLLYVSLHLSFMEWTRYPIDTAFRLFGTASAIVGLFYGVQIVEANVITNSFDGIVIGFFLIQLASSMSTNAFYTISKEASWGTLERHFISPFSFELVLFTKVFAKQVKWFIFSSITLLFLMVATQTWLKIPVFTVVTISSLSILPMAGVGFALGGLAILYKRVGSINNFIVFPIMGLVSAPIIQVPWIRALPLVQGSSMLQESMKRGVRIWEFDAVSLAILVVVGVVYFVTGFVVFRFCSLKARDQGVLSDY